MAAGWTYSDWETQATFALRLERLRLHIVEVSDRLLASPAYSVDGVSVSRDLTSYLALLKAERAKLEDDVAGERVGWTRGRAVL